MTEVLFVLLIVYVVYVIQTVIYTKDTKKESPIEVKSTTVAETIKQPEPKAVVEKAKPAPKKPTASKKVTAVKAKPVSGSLRNPETGDVDKIASSYRMTKRWIKEALVTEGLLPKIYKTTEIDDAVKLKANQALAKLAKMDKYQ
ncbi:MAG: hypothetical protein QM500_04735 [Methylococcales bacterium]